LALGQRRQGVGEYYKLLYGLYKSIYDGTSQQQKR
jgi:hypothetical protein